MFKAILIENDSEKIITADEVLAGMYDRNSDFLDCDYNFRVTFVKGAKNNGAPHFRLYYTKEYYDQLDVEKKTKYDILRNYKHYGESPWHKEWKNTLSNYGWHEKLIKNENTKVRKRADIYIPLNKLVIELQHSYIDNTFEDRSEFYKELGLNIIWLFDFTDHEGFHTEDDYIQLVEDNTKGFFKVSRKPDNLLNYPVFIQVKDNTIYKVSKLEQKESTSKIKSSIWLFKPDVTYTPEEFVNAIKHNAKELYENAEELHTIAELWDSKYKNMLLYNTEDDKYLIIYNKNGKISRDFNYGCIRYREVEKTYISDYYKLINEKDFFTNLKKDKENKKIWKLIKPNYFVD